MAPTDTGKGSDSPTEFDPAGGLLPDDAEFLTRLESEHLERLYAAAPLSQLGAVLLGAVGVLLASRYTQPRASLLAAWALGLAATALLRLALARRFARTVPDGRGLRPWQRRTMVALALSGTVWGLYPWLAPPGLGKAFLPVAALLLVAVTGGSLVLVTAHRRYYLSFGLPLFLLLLARLLLVPPRALFLAGTTGVIFLCLERAADRARRILGALVRNGETNARLSEAFRRQSETLAEERDRLERLLESVPAPVAHCDTGLVLRRHNRSFRDLFLRDGETLEGRPLAELLGKRRFRTLAPHCRAALEGETRVFELTLPARGPDGLRRRTYRISLTPDRRPERRGASGLYAHLVDVTAYKTAEARLAAAALRDPLTGLYNRRGFEDALARTLARDPHAVHSILYVDLDRLKEINDRFGHDAGDAALRAFAKRLLGSVRSDDCCARLGGDEFAILLRHCPPECVERVTRTLVTSLGRPFAYGDSLLSLSASVGGVSFTPDATSGQDAVAAADLCMYEAKRERQPVLRRLG